MNIARPIQRHAFTRAELLVVIAVIGLLALTQLAGFARHGEVSKAAICLNNLAQLQRAWQLYADDHGGRIVAAQQNTVNDSPVWANPFFELVIGQPYNPADILKPTPLWPYTIRHPRLWRCPNDPATFTRPRTGTRYPTLRSYSMNNWVNGAEWGPSASTGWLVYRKQEDMNDPGPASTVVLIEEHPLSLNDAAFVIDMAGFPNEQRNWRIVDYPASAHSQAASVSYADGHVELKRWMDARTIVNYQQSALPLNSSQTFNLDVRWLQERATRQISSSN